jgi:hypothetical protein
MRLLVAILAGLTLGGCAYMDAGIREYEVVQTAKRDGTTGAKSVLVRAISADMPGLTEMQTPSGLRLTFSSAVEEQQQAVFNKDGNFVTTLVSRTLAGFYPSRTILASGEKSRVIIKEGGATATGVILSTGAAAMSAGLPGAATSVANTVIKP